MSSGRLGKRTRRIPYKSDHGINHSSPQADINVTPLVDVCLVLLIIFMVVTPMLGRGKDVKLPVLAEATQWKEGEQVFVSVTNEGVWIDQDPYIEKKAFLGVLEDKLKEAAGKATAVDYKGPLLFIKGDEETDWRNLRIVMDWISNSDSQLTDIALVVDLEEAAG